MKVYYFHNGQTVETVTLKSEQIVFDRFGNKTYNGHFLYETKSSCLTSALN